VNLLLKDSSVTYTFAAEVAAVPGSTAFFLGGIDHNNEWM
jgi:hypothetical protein